MALRLIFSTGTFVSGLVDHEFTLKNHTFDTTITDMTGVERTITVDTSQILRKNKSPFKIGVGVMAHAYGRDWGCGFTRFSLSTGFLLNTDGEIQYLGGTSVLLGRYQRWVLTWRVCCWQSQTPRVRAPSRRLF